MKVRREFQKERKALAAKVSKLNASLSEIRELSEVSENDSVDE